MFTSKLKAKIDALEIHIKSIEAKCAMQEETIKRLQDENVALTRNKPRILELLKLFDDVALTGQGLLKVERVNSDEVFLWHQS